MDEQELAREAVRQARGDEMKVPQQAEDEPANCSDIPGCDGQCCKQAER